MLRNVLLLDHDMHFPSQEELERSQRISRAFQQEVESWRSTAESRGNALQAIRSELRHFAETTMKANPAVSAPQCSNYFSNHRIILHLLSCRIALRFPLPMAPLPFLWFTLTRQPSVAEAIDVLEVCDPPQLST